MAATFIATAPPKNNFINEARALRKVGGVATLINNGYQWIQLFYRTFASFENVALHLL